MSKYLAKKININGETFDSKKEAKRYEHLLFLLQSGEIADLQRQVKYVLIPPQREEATVGKRGGIKQGKIIERECYYVADFVYTDKLGKVHVEDVKGYKFGTAYNVFSIKRKLMLKNYGIRIEEI